MIAHVAADNEKHKTESPEIIRILSDYDMTPAQLERFASYRPPIEADESSEDESSDDVEATDKEATEGEQMFAVELATHFGAKYEEHIDRILPRIDQSNKHHLCGMKK